METTLADNQSRAKETLQTELATPQRLYSLDALRGFDMFWIIGGEDIFHGLAKATGSPFWTSISNQFTHPYWNGFHIYDLIFPLFLFLSGVATPYSIGRELQSGKTKEELLLRVIKRALILVLLGIVYNNGLELRPISEIRYVSVLSRIGIGYMFANIIYLYSREMTQVLWFWGLLIGYWLLLKFNSAPGFPSGDLTMEGNFGSYIDRLIIPGVLSRGIHDTTGFIFNIPAVSTGLLGVLAGNLLIRNTITPQRKVLLLLAIGTGIIILAQIWDLDFPINKNLWSSSFVLLTGGLSLILLAIFYHIIDVKGYKDWAFFFKVIGMNSILIYISWRFIDWGYTTQGILHWLDQIIGVPYNIVFMALCKLAIEWAVLYFLYRKKVFLRV
jgi:predicted acyltransferase